MAVIKAEPQPLLPLLKQFFGFTSFRPLQEEIIRDALAGKDVFALLPTGGGKSLCFPNGCYLAIVPIFPNLRSSRNHKSFDNERE